ncbi:class I SAM-dependent methyltransferase [Streptomyces sp. ICBB 8177]|uniref:class I SAM-dependent methyltransferase n=1 Tax=Streptomyces sp. ICBB 8177 TaxID=563922 RepID=UPI000D67AE72|nr:class I SAM-dependent methyltransferase [Streptomyces sp. ICBB 8177]PWI42192.1 SAM-dependent methyltransferase [Streptomyces sp. ICBB 8177]
MLDYDGEAARYDATRGGVPRARAAAEAVLRLLPASAGDLLDVGCGTGLVPERLRRPGLRVVGADASAGMTAVAAPRLGGRVVRADGLRLPFAARSFDAVCAVWLLHLLPRAADVVSEAARLLRPGGVLVTTVDKDAGHDVGSDIDALLAPYRVSGARDAADAITARAARAGLRPAGETAFTGYGQGRTPLGVAADVRAGRLPSAVRVTDDAAGRLIGLLAALPDPRGARRDPVYRLMAFERTT